MMPAQSAWSTLRCIVAALLATTVAACFGDGDGLILESSRRASVVGDSVSGSPAVLSTADPGAIELPSPARLRITLVERNASWWHALYVEQPQDTLLAGPGYLFPGPSFDVGPYGPGIVVLRLESYDPREPHGFFGTAAQRVSGTYPSWIVAFEDGADGDFDDIVVSVEALPLSRLTVTCTPPELTRGQWISCEPGTSPPGAQLEVTGWRFVGGQNDQYVIPHAAEPPPEKWEGPMVVGGTVTVFATVDGTPDSASTSVTVNPREWPNPPMDWPPEDRGIGPDMNAVPQADHDLGHAHTLPQYASGYPNDGYVAGVPSGPNYLLFYLTQPPIERIEAWVEINRDALTNPSNPFYQAHGGFMIEPGMCRQADLRGRILNLVVDHENDHQIFARNWYMANNINQLLEGVVDNGGAQALVDAVAAELEVQIEALDSANTAAVDPIRLPCKLVFITVGGSSP